MMQVKLRKLGLALTSATTLAAAAGGGMGCTLAMSDEPADDPAAHGQVSSPSTIATILLRVEGDWSFGSERVRYTVEDTTAQDPFVRTGDHLALTLPAYFLWSKLHNDPYQSLPNDIDRIKQLKADVTATFFRRGAVVGSATVQTSTWSTPSYSYDLSVETDHLVLPAEVDVVRFSFALGDDGDPTATADIAIEQSNGVVVFGSNESAKSLLFDSDFAQLQQKIIEGGDLQAGGKFLLSYTDYRANTISDTATINTQVGTQKTWGRFGEAIVPLHGEIEHEVLFGTLFDDGTGWRNEEVLVERYDTAMLPDQQPWAQRHTYERLLQIPAGATEMKIYFHIKTYLVVDYSKYPNAIDKTWQEGRHLVRESWDDDGYGQNYSFGLQQGPVTPEPDWAADERRTVIFVHKETSPGQDMFVLGGVDHTVSHQLLGRLCTDGNGDPNGECAVPMSHLNHQNQYTEPWKSGDTQLDWYGPEAGQTGEVDGVSAAGSPAEWTSSYWPSSWGPERTVAGDGYGLTDLNTDCGPNCWMLDVELDCSQAYHSPDGTAWVELKTFVTGGPGWESDVDQAGQYNGGIHSPYASKNHQVRCGMVNTFYSGSSTVQFKQLP